MGSTYAAIGPQPQAAVQAYTRCRGSAPTPLRFCGGWERSQQVRRNLLCLLTYSVSYYQAPLKNT